MPFPETCERDVGWILLDSQLSFIVRKVRIFYGIANHRGSPVQEGRQVGNVVAWQRHLWAHEQQHVYRALCPQFVFPNSQASVFRGLLFSMLMSFAASPEWGVASLAEHAAV